MSSNRIAVAIERLRGGVGVPGDGKWVCLVCGPPPEVELRLRVTLVHCTLQSVLCLTHADSDSVVLVPSPLIPSSPLPSPPLPLPSPPLPSPLLPFPPSLPQKRLPFWVCMHVTVWRRRGGVIDITGEGEGMEEWV